MEGVMLLDAGLRIKPDGDQLLVRGPKRAEPLVNADCSLVRTARSRRPRRDSSIRRRTEAPSAPAAAEAKEPMANPGPHRGERARVPMTDQKLGGRATMPEAGILQRRPLINSCGD